MPGKRRFERRAPLAIALTRPSVSVYRWTTRSDSPWSNVRRTRRASDTPRAWAPVYAGLFSVQELLDVVGLVDPLRASRRRARAGEPEAEQPERRPEHEREGRGAADPGTGARAARAAARRARQRRRAHARRAARRPRRDRRRSRSASDARGRAADAVGIERRARLFDLAHALGRELGARRHVEDRDPAQLALPAIPGPEDAPIGWTVAAATAAPSGSRSTCAPTRSRPPAPPRHAASRRR